MNKEFDQLFLGGMPVLSYLIEHIGMTLIAKIILSLLLFDLDINENKTFHIGSVWIELILLKLKT